MSIMEGKDKHLFLCLSVSFCSSTVISMHPAYRLYLKTEGVTKIIEREKQHSKSVDVNVTALEHFTVSLCLSALAT